MFDVGWVGYLSMALFGSVTVVTAGFLISEWMRKRHEYRMKLAEQNHEIAENVESPRDSDYVVVEHGGEEILVERDHELAQEKLEAEEE